MDARTVIFVMVVVVIGGVLLSHFALSIYRTPTGYSGAFAVGGGNNCPSVFCTERYPTYTSPTFSIDTIPGPFNAALAAKCLEQEPVNDCDSEIQTEGMACTNAGCMLGGSKNAGVTTGMCYYKLSSSGEPQCIGYNTSGKNKLGTNSPQTYYTVKDCPLGSQTSAIFAGLNPGEGKCIFDCHEEISKSCVQPQKKTQ